MTAPIDDCEDWDEAQRELYIRMLRFMLDNQELCKHPATAKLPDEQWETICHNASTLAADLIDGGNLAICDDDFSVLATTDKPQFVQ